MPVIRVVMFGYDRASDVHFAFVIETSLPCLLIALFGMPAFAGPNRRGSCSMSWSLYIYLLYSICMVQTPDQ